MGQGIGLEVVDGHHNQVAIYLQKGEYKLVCIKDSIALWNAKLMK